MYLVNRLHFMNKFVHHPITEVEQSQGERRMPCFARPQNQLTEFALIFGREKGMAWRHRGDECPIPFLPVIEYALSISSRIVQRNNPLLLERYSSFKGLFPCPSKHDRPKSLSGVGGAVKRRWVANLDGSESHESRHRRSC